MTIFVLQVSTTAQGIRSQRIPMDSRDENLVLSNLLPSRTQQKLALVGIFRLFGIIPQPIALLAALTIISLWIRQKSLLDLWLMVVMLVFMTEVLISCFPFLPGSSWVGMQAGPAVRCPAASFCSFC